MLGNIPHERSYGIPPSLYHTHTHMHTQPNGVTTIATNMTLASSKTPYVIALGKGRVPFGQGIQVNEQLCAAFGDQITQHKRVPKKQEGS